MTEKSRAKQIEELLGPLLEDGGFSKVGSDRWERVFSIGMGRVLLREDHRMFKLGLDPQVYLYLRDSEGYVDFARENVGFLQKRGKSVYDLSGLFGFMGRAKVTSDVKAALDWFKPFENVEYCKTYFKDEAFSTCLPGSENYKRISKILK